MSSPRESGPQKPPRRRPEPMPGGWLWVIVLLLFGGVLWIVVGVTSPGTISYSDFVQLAQKDKFTKVVIRGSSRVVGEFKEDEAKNLPEHLKKYERYNRVETNTHPEQIRELTKALENHVPYRFEDESGAWIGPFFVYVFPMIIII